MTIKSALLNEVRRLMDEDERKDHELAIELDVSPSTIYNIRRGNHPSPGVVIIERLYKLLTGKNLEI